MQMITQTADRDLQVRFQSKIERAMGVPELIDLVRDEPLVASYYAAAFRSLLRSNAAGFS